MCWVTCDEVSMVKFYECFSSESGEGNGNPLQCSCLENPMDGEAWQATVQGVRKESDTTE